jgi:endoglucanase
MSKFKFVKVVLLLLSTNTISSQSLAHKRCNEFRMGISFSILENYQGGNPSINYMNYLDGNEVILRKNRIALADSLGYKILRFPIAFDHWENHKSPLFLIDSTNYFKAVDSLVLWTLSHKMKAVLDFHHGSLSATNFTYTLNRTNALWTQIANHYKNTSPDSVFFELYNEPYNFSDSLWAVAAASLVNNVRAVVPNHTLIIGGNNWNGSGQLHTLEKIKDTNIIYTFHFYEPTIFTHQGAEWIGNAVATKNMPWPYNASTMPSLDTLAKGTWGENAYYGYQIWGSPDSLKRYLSYPKQWSNKTGKPIWCGEWGSYKAYSDPASRCRYAKFMMETFDTLKIPHAMWEFDKGFGFFNGDPFLNNIDSCFKYLIYHPKKNDSIPSNISFRKINSSTIFFNNSISISSEIGAHLLIFNQMGQIVRNLTLKDAETIVNTSELKEGVYFILIEKNGERKAKKVVKNSSFDY